MIPPFEKHALANELEPRCELEGFVLKHSFEVLLGDPARVSHFVRVNVEIYVGLDEEDVID